ncbi:hypothetical protein [Emticicia sp. 21SJ11W-3]|uniref:hypothetical protein n=1 Tax=Emticicia sp. 21SJ11W-3 TaxID=2916755 RepID=UPI0020A11641|nr:hypothetical protein [Emticicia sp. 21SJ11W-3]UTA67282.1 hypothetical protein MB380_16965 [Emticicia sp. 21SJ11W-3]
MKAAKLANAIQKVAEISDRLDVTSKIMSKVGMGFKKGAGKVGKFVIRNAAGGIIGTAFDVVDGVYKNVKKKTSSAYNVFLGTIEGQVQFIGEKTQKVRCNIWGKCSSGAGGRVDATNPPNLLSCVDDAAMETIDVFKRALHKNELNNMTYKKYKSDRDKGIITNLTGHHAPSVSYFEQYCEKMGLDKKMIMGGGHGDDLMTILLESGKAPGRHSRTKTFKNNLGSKRPDYYDLIPSEALKYEIEDMA